MTLDLLQASVKLSEQLYRINKQSNCISVIGVADTLGIATLEAKVSILAFETRGGSSFFSRAGGGGVVVGEFSKKN